MSGSFTRVNYRLRPAKGVERRMMADAFLRLWPFGRVESYRYVGMGSVYFADFALFNTVCGFTHLVSIEDAEDLQTQNRFKFNVPLGSIELKFGHSNVELPKLHWDNVRTICWLDYDWQPCAPRPHRHQTSRGANEPRQLARRHSRHTTQRRGSEQQTESAREASRPNRIRSEDTYLHRSSQETRNVRNSNRCSGRDNDSGADGRN